MAGSKGSRIAEKQTIAQIESYRLKTKRDFRRKNGWMQIGFDLDIAPAACLLYLMQQWGFKSRREAVQVCLQYMAKQTRLGMKRIDLGWDD